MTHTKHKRSADRRVEYAERGKEFSILSRCSLFCEYIDLEYVRIHVILQGSTGGIRYSYSCGCASGIHEYVFNMSAADAQPEQVVRTQETACSSEFRFRRKLMGRPHTICGLCASKTGVPTPVLDANFGRPHNICGLCASKTGVGLFICSYEVHVGTRTHWTASHACCGASAPRDAAG